MGPRLLKEIVSELDQRLRGAIVSKVHQSDERTLILRMFTRGADHRVLISVHPRSPRMHLTERRLQNPPAPLRFCAYLRKRIANARVEGLTQLDSERIVFIDLSVKVDGGYEPVRLVAELTGKSGNVILLDKAGVVEDAMRYFPPGTSARAVYPGLRLEPLPPAPELKEEPPLERKEGEGWNEAADRRYSPMMDAEALEAERSRLGRAVADAGKRLARKLGNLEGDRAKAEEGLRFYSIGEMLNASFHLIERGASEAEVVDYAKDPPERVMVALDPRLGPRENVERYFKKAKKSKRALELLKERIPATARELEYVETLDYELESARGADALEEVRAALVEGGYLKEEAVREGAAERRAEPVRRFTSSEGFEILCGKSGAGNDLLVTRYAAGEDLWFHVKGLPGSHALIKVAGRKGELTKKTIEEAASIAAFYSKARNAGKAEVIYAEARHVKKPRGAKPGLVTVKEHKGVLVRPGLPKGASEDE